MLHHMNAVWHAERLVKDSCGKTIEFLPAADQPHIRDGVVGSTEWARGQCRAVAGAADDARDPVVSIASARLRAGRIVTKRLASIHRPELGVQRWRRW
jgi:hypothetical protein